MHASCNNNLNNRIEGGRINIAVFRNVIPISRVIVNVAENVGHIFVSFVRLAWLASITFFKLVFQSLRSFACWFSLCAAFRVAWCEVGYNAVGHYIVKFFFVADVWENHQVQMQIFRSLGVGKFVSKLSITSSVEHLRTKTI